MLTGSTRVEASANMLTQLSRPDGYFLPSNPADPPTAKYLLPLQSKGLTFVSLGAKQGKGAKPKAPAEGDQEGRHSSRGSPLPSVAKGTLLGVADAMGGAMRRYSNLQGKPSSGAWTAAVLRYCVVNIHIYLFLVRLCAALWLSLLACLGTQRSKGVDLMLQAAYTEAKLILWVRSRRLAGRLMMSITHPASASRQQGDEYRYLVVVITTVLGS